MKFIDLVKFSWSSLLKRKFRTVLTVLGVVIGCISIVVMISLGIGMKSALLDSYTSNDSIRCIDVYQGYGTNNGEASNDTSMYLSDSLIERFSNMEHVERVVPVLTSNAILKINGYCIDTQVSGIPVEEFQKIDVKLECGHMPTDPNEMYFLIGNNVLSNIYIESNNYYPYWETGEVPNIDFSKDPMYAIFDTGAYFAKKSANNQTQGETPGASTVNTNYNKHIVLSSALIAGGPDYYGTSGDYGWSVYCPLDALIQALRKDYKGRVISGQPTKKNGSAYKEIFYSRLCVYADDMDNVVALQEQINGMGYNTHSQMEWISESMSTLNIIQIALGGIGGVALLVAAIGITNTMSMSIYERTKEIGIMKVLGCRLKDIQMMFLMEAGYIGLLGGVVGLVISYALSYVINSVTQGVMQDLIGEAGQLSKIPLWLGIVSLVFSILISMLAGFFPSVRAMRLSPLTAIRNE